jgi:hypothetical protein
MNFLSPLPGLKILLDVFPQLSLWATSVRHSVAETMTMQFVAKTTAPKFQNCFASLRLCVKIKP